MSYGVLVIAMKFETEAHRISFGMISLLQLLSCNAHSSGISNFIFPFVFAFEFHVIIASASAPALSGSSA